MTKTTPNGGMPPGRRIPGNNVMDNLVIKRNILIATGQKNYRGLPKFDKGANTLWVFINGKKEYCGAQLDYVELSDNTIQFNKDVPKGAVIEILVFEIIQ